MDNEEVVVDTLTPQEEPEESAEELKARLAKAEEVANNYKIRAEKAEARAKEEKEEVKSPLNLSAGDMMAIKNANVDPEDMDAVEDFAKWRKISLREALVHPEMKAILDYRNEIKTTTVATNVENVRRGATKINDETLVMNASMGKIPTSDDEIEALVAAKFKRK